MFDVTINHHPDDSGYAVTIRTARLDGMPDEKHAWHAYDMGGPDAQTRAQAYESARQYGQGAVEAFRAAGLRCDHNLGAHVLRELAAIREAEKVAA